MSNVAGACRSHQRRPHSSAGYASSSRSRWPRSSRAIDARRRDSPGGGARNPRSADMAGGSRACRARLAPSARTSASPSGTSARFARQPMPLRDAGEALHDEEFAAEDARVAAKEQRFRRDDACGVRDAQYRELLRAGQTRRDARRCIGAQDEAMLALPCAAVDVDVEQPVVLDRAAGQPLVARDAARGLRASARRSQRAIAVAAVRLRERRRSRRFRASRNRGCPAECAWRC